MLSQGVGLDNNDRPIERLAIAESTNSAALYNVGVRLGKSIFALICDAEVIARTIDEVYGRVVTSQDNSNESDLFVVDGGTALQIDRLLAEADRDLLSTQGKGPIIKLVDALLFEALGRSGQRCPCSALGRSHAGAVSADGVLHTVRQLPPQVTQALISRIKVMGRMDIAERRIPQDGRATVTIGSDGHGRSIDLRISTLPTSYGERGDPVAGQRAALSTTTRSACPRKWRSVTSTCATRPRDDPRDRTDRFGQDDDVVRHVAGRDRVRDLNIMTIEDPIEYELSFAGSDKPEGAGIAISQSQVNTKKGVTFATGLRTFRDKTPMW